MPCGGNFGSGGETERAGAEAGPAGARCESAPRDGRRVWVDRMRAAVDLHTCRDIEEAQRGVARRSDLLLVRRDFQLVDLRLGVLQRLQARAGRRLPPAPAR